MVAGVLSVIARGVLAVNGWTLIGEPLRARSYVLIAAPHTSNWDLFHLLTLAFRYQVKIHWMGKHQIFRAPFGRLMRILGGIPIYRERRDNVVEQMAKRLVTGEPMILVVPAAGTRRYSEYWKSGFYHIAKLARVPIRLGYLDYPKKHGSFGPELMPSGDIPGDMDQIREFYADKTGRHPANKSRIRLREED